VLLVPSSPVSPVTPTVVLTIAGSDSGGGAGVQADLRTFAALGLFATTAITAVTAQNTVGVLAVEAMPPQLVIDQVEAVLDDLDPAAVKTGMLARPETVAAVAELAAAGRLPNLVVDPVLVSSTGHPLMDEGGIGAYRELLLPHAAIATPNLREAAALTNRSLKELASIEAMEAVAEELRALGSQTVVVKGGHLRAAEASAAQTGPAAPAPSQLGSPDVVCSAKGVWRLSAERVDTCNDHGTGCTLSAAIAGFLAQGADHLEAITRAKHFVHEAIRDAASWRLGAGHGPIDHFGWARTGTLSKVTVARPVTK